MSPTGLSPREAQSSSLASQHMRPLKADKTPMCKKIIQMEQDGITEQNCILARIVKNKSCKSPDKVLHQFSQIIFDHFCGTN